MKTPAGNLRGNQTDAERKLWRYVRNRRLAGCKFRRQHLIGPYIVDLVCLECRLVVEIDGGQHSQNIEYDAHRTAFLRSQGFRVLRFWNNEVMGNTEEVLEVVRKALLGPPHPTLSRKGRGSARDPSPSLLPQGERRCTWNAG